MKVLFVDDDYNITSFVRMGLGDLGFIVDIAHDGTDGKNVALINEYDIIILDALMPGIDGFALCKEIRDHNIKTPVLMLTSLDSEEVRKKGGEAGADDYLIKPFVLPELISRIRILNGIEL